MKNYIIPMLLISIILLSGCTKADEEDQKNVGTLTFPIASFSFTGNDGPAPVTVAFHNSSEYSDQWEWTFHNGAKSNEFEPSFTYYNNTDTDITYLVILKVTDSGSGETNTRSKVVVVHPSN
jgi:PKD repeat protein